MRGGDGEEREVLVDASVLITLAEIEGFSLLYGLDGPLVVPEAVETEVTSDPAATALSNARADGAIRVVEADHGLEDAAAHLGTKSQDRPRGDTALLALALGGDGRVLVTDDRPLRKTCKALSIPVSGSIGVLVRAVERGDVDPEVAKEKLYAMDEVGARLSASLIRRAESLIEAADTS